MTAKGIDVLLLSVGADLPWLTGYEAMPLERLTMLVAHRDGEATLVVPRLEAPRVVEQPGVFTIRPWAETDDPVAIVAGLAGAARTAAIGDTTWARFLLALQSGHAVDGVHASGRGHRRPSRAEGCRARSTRCDGPARRPTAWQRRCRPATSPSSGAPRPRCRPRSRRGCSPRAITR